MSTKASRTRAKTMAEIWLHIMVTQGSVCVIPGCDEPWTDPAHIDASGMGGRPSTNVEGNIVGMCRSCHDVFDGRVLQGRQHMLRVLLAALVER